MTKAKSSREKILDAAKAVMTEEGFAAVSSRRVAAKAGLKPQLIHYHFESMDHLLIELFTLLGNDVIEKQRSAIKSEHPLKDLWNLLSDRDMRVTLEQFLIMSRYNDDLQKKLGEFGNIFRHDQIAFLTDLMRENNFHSPHWSPEFLSILFNALARVIAIEPTYGLNLGISEAMSTINHYIEQFDRGISSPEMTIKRLEHENAQLRETISKLAQSNK
ncbi:MAG: TetR/AcrR family transcriptional regulator [Novosphingobium sp.]|nr:TetR/AcrR family transcriptional regulator [Novosphingobium sp.]